MEERLPRLLTKLGEKVISSQKLILTMIKKSAWNTLSRSETFNFGGCQGKNREAFICKMAKRRIKYQTYTHQLLFSGLRADFIAQNFFHSLTHNKTSENFKQFAKKFLFSEVMRQSC